MSASGPRPRDVAGGSRVVVGATPEGERRPAGSFFAAIPFEGAVLDPRRLSAEEFLRRL